MFFRVSFLKFYYALDHLKKDLNQWNTKWLLKQMKNQSASHAYRSVEGPRWNGAYSQIANKRWELGALEAVYYDYYQ